jgi:hypothetical protein
MTPTWLRIGALLVDKETRLLVEIVAIHGDNVTIEYDDDGSTQDYAVDQVVSDFTPWKEGDEVHDRTGKGRFVNPGHPDYRPKQ